MFITADKYFISSNMDRSIISDYSVADIKVSILKWICPMFYQDKGSTFAVPWAIHAGWKVNAFQF